MPRRVIFLSTVMSVASQFTELAHAMLPQGTEAWHIVDEMLARLAVAEGRLSPLIYRRVADHARAAQEAGADVLQFTCSSISPCIGAVRSLVDMPVLTVDEELVDRALADATRIGIAATAVTALDPLAAQVRGRAAQLGKPVDVQPVLCEGAYAGLISGDLASHDRIVRAALEDLTRRADLVLLAQASMTRVADAMPQEAGAAPILSSAPFAVQRLLRTLEAK